MSLNFLSGFAKAISRLIAFVVWFFPWLWRVIKASRLGAVIVGLIDIIKSIGVTRVLAYAFILGFVFKAGLNYVRDGNFTVFMVSTTRVFVAAEEQAIQYTNQLLNEPQTMWSALYLYLLIFGSFLVFYYMYLFVTWVFRFLMSDSSKKGVGPMLIAITIIFLAEAMFLGMTAMASEGNGWDSLTVENTMPFRGFRYFVSNIPNLPGLGSAIDTSHAQNTTIEELTNISNVEKPRGALSTLLCVVSPFC